MDLMDLPVPGMGGWPTSIEVAEVLRRLDPAHYAGAVQFRYTPGMGPPRTAEEIAEGIVASTATARLMSSSVVLPTREEVEGRLREYIDDPDYKVRVRQLDSGPKAGLWSGQAVHRDFENF
jgi:hypothetical protein